MSRHFSLEDLPPRYRAIAEAQLRSGNPTAPLHSALQGQGQPRQPAVDSEPSRAETPAEEVAEPRRAPRSDKRRGPNKTEQRFNREMLGGRGRFEAISLRLPGGSRYTPDFVEFDIVTGAMTAYEIKGSYRFPSEGRALTAFREAREAFSPSIVFRWYRLDKGGVWREEHVQTPAPEPRDLLPF